MADAETKAERTVGGWELYLRRAPGEIRWEVSLCERVLNAPTALAERVLRSKRPSARHFDGKTFANPDEAAEFVRRLVA